MSLCRIAWIAALLPAWFVGAARADIIDLDDFLYGRQSRHSQNAATTYALSTLTYSPDGKTLVAGGRGGFTFWHAESGAALAGLPITSGHGTGVLFSPDGKSLFTADAIGNVLRWDADKRLVTFRYPRVHAVVERLALSADGSTLAVSDGQSTTFWDARSGKLLHTWKALYARRCQVRQVLTPDGQWCAHLRDDTAFQLRSTRSDLIKRSWPNHAVASIDISADGKLYAAALTNGDLTLLDGGSLTTICVLQGPGAVCAVRLSPEGKTLIAHNGVGHLAAYDLTGEFARRAAPPRWALRTDPAWRVVTVAFSPDGATLATACSDRRIRVHDLTTGKIVREIVIPEPRGTSSAAPWSGEVPLPASAQLRLGVHPLWYPSPIHAGSFLAGGKELLLLSTDAATGPFVFDTHSGKPVRRLEKLRAHLLGLEEDSTWFDDEPNISIAFRSFTGGYTPSTTILSADRKHLLIARGNRLTWWDMVQERPVNEYRFPSAIVATAIAPTGKRFAVAGRAEPGCPQPLFVWDLETGTMQPLSGHETAIHYLAFSPDGKRLFSSNAPYRLHRDELIPGKLIEWDLASGAITRSRTHAAEKVAMSPDGTRLAVQEDSGHIRLIDWARQINLASIVSQEHFLFAPDSRTLAVGGRTPVTLWNIISGKRIRTFQGHVEQGTTPLCFSDDGQTLATCESLAASSFGWAHGSVYEVGAARSSGGAIRLWNVATGEEKYPDSHHRGPINCVVYAPDGRVIVSAGADRRLLWWDAKAGKLLSAAPAWTEQTEGHRSPIYQLAFSADDGKRIASVCDQRLLVWDAPSRKLVQSWTLEGWKPLGIRFSPAGDLLTSRTNGAIETWDIATGKVKTSFNARINKDYDLAHAVFSPDGTQVAVLDQYAHDIALWQVGTQKVVRQLAIAPPRDGENYYARHTCSAIVFSPDGRYVGAGVVEGAYGRRYRGSMPRTTVAVWEIASGEKALSLRDVGYQVSTLAFSPDGRTFLHGVNDTMQYGYYYGSRRGNERNIVLRDLAAGPELTQLSWTGPARVCESTGWELREVAGLFDKPGRVAFSPDGRSLVTIDHDHNLLVWDVRALVRHAETARDKLDPAELEQAWHDLGHIVQANAAMRRLTADPGATLAFLRARLRAPSIPNEQRLSHALRNLGSAAHAARNGAMAELRDHAELAEPMLRAAWLKEAQPERKYRLQALLSRIQDDRDADWLRMLRGIEVVERLDDPAARLLLAELAAGPPEARITREARAALARRERR